MPILYQYGLVVVDDYSPTMGAMLMIDISSLLLIQLLIVQFHQSQAFYQQQKLRIMFFDCTVTKSKSISAYIRMGP